jgi:hypothetical protein
VSVVQACSVLVLTSLIRMGVDGMSVGQYQPSRSDS